MKTGFYSEKQKILTGTVLYKDAEGNIFEVTSIVNNEQDQDNEYENMLSQNFGDVKVISRKLTEFVSRKDEPKVSYFDRKDRTAQDIIQANQEILLALINYKVKKLRGEA